MNKERARSPGPHFILGAAALVLAGCGGGGGSSQPPQQPPATNSPPTANAGADQLVSTGAAVSLSGSGTDTDGTIASYAWTQTGGTAVTLSGASTATPTFTAPAIAGALEFQLTVVDDQGASHSDLVSVQVNASAAPVIAFHPVSITAFENGNAFLFVVASGEDLTYEWHYTSGVLAYTSDEPFMPRTSVDINHCYYVVVSNAVGSATSESACIDVIPASGVFDPGDDLPGDDLALATSYGNALLDIARAAAGGLTSAAPHRSAVPSIVGPGSPCSGGEQLSAAFDGAVVTAPLMLPIGQHSVAFGFDHCGNGDPDEPSEQVGAVRIDYDFPNEFGVGTYRMIFSGYGYDEDVMSGVVNVTTARSTSISGWPEDQVGILIAENFSAALMNANSPFAQSIDLTRRLKMDNVVITDATLEFDVTLQIFDENGFAGTAYKKESAILDLQLHNAPEPGEGEEGGSPTAEGDMVVGLNSSATYTLGTIQPFWAGAAEWRYTAVPPDEED